MVNTKYDGDLTPFTGKVAIVMNPDSGGPAVHIVRTSNKYEIGEEICHTGVRVLAVLNGARGTRNYQSRYERVAKLIMELDSANDDGFHFNYMIAEMLEEVFYAGIKLAPVIVTLPDDVSRYYEPCRKK